MTYRSPQFFTFIPSACRQCLTTILHSLFRSVGQCLYILYGPGAALVHAALTVSLTYSRVGSLVFNWVHPGVGDVISSLQEPAIPLDYHCNLVKGSVFVSSLSAPFSCIEGVGLLSQDVLELCKDWSFFLSQLPVLLFQVLPFFPELGDLALLPVWPSSVVLGFWLCDAESLSTDTAD